MPPSRKAYIYIYIYVELAPEDRLPGEENMYGVLNYSMYGTRKAATNWQQHYTNVLNKIGFKTGLSNPCVFHHEQRGIITMVHGDDFASTQVQELMQILNGLELNLKKNFF